MNSAICFEVLDPRRLPHDAVGKVGFASQRLPKQPGRRLGGVGAGRADCEDQFAGVGEVFLIEPQSAHRRHGLGEEVQHFSVQSHAGEPRDDQSPASTQAQRRRIRVMAPESLRAPRPWRHWSDASPPRSALKTPAAASQPSADFLGARTRQHAAARRRIRWIADAAEAADSTDQRPASARAVASVKGGLANCTKQSRSARVASRISPATPLSVRERIQTACPCRSDQPDSKSAGGKDGTVRQLVSRHAQTSQAGSPTPACGAEGGSS